MGRTICLYKIRYGGCLPRLKSSFPNSMDTLEGGEKKENKERQHERQELSNSGGLCARLHLTVNLVVKSLS